MKFTYKESIAIMKLLVKILLADEEAKDEELIQLQERLTELNLRDVDYPEVDRLPYEEALHILANLNSDKKHLVSQWLYEMILVDGIVESSELIIYIAVCSILELPNLHLTNSYKTTDSTLINKITKQNIQTLVKVAFVLVTPEGHTPENLRFVNEVYMEEVPETLIQEIMAGVQMPIIVMVENLKYLTPKEKEVSKIIINKLTNKFTSKTVKNLATELTKIIDTGRYKESEMKELSELIEIEKGKAN